MEKQIINFMPGPVNLHPEVKEVYYQNFLSHRSAKFYNDVTAFRTDLCNFVKAREVAFLVGSGSIANEVVGQYLKHLPGKGLILVNGEFGKRIKEQASYIELNFDLIEEPLGTSFNYSAIEQSLSSTRYAWLWFVNCETSSGVLNNLPRLKELCARYQTKLAVDCISSIANTDVDLSGVYMASCTSGKGLASYPGLALVFFDDQVLNQEVRGIPKYFNLKHHRDTNWVPYTVNTNLFYSLIHAFKGVAHSSHRENIKKISDYIYDQCAKLGFSFLGHYEHTMPGIISIICPPHINSYELGVELEKNHFYVNYGGAYLRQANYFQICIMGHQEMENAKKIVDFLATKKIAVPEMVKA